MTLPFTYTLKTNLRAKHMSIRISRTSEVFVTKPKQVSVAIIEDFIARKKDWIIEKCAYAKTLPQPVRKISREEVRLLKVHTKELVEKRVKHFNQFYNFEYKNIFIKNQKTRWGSCSSQKNLNFNCKIALLDQELIDYIVVHELCHLAQMNHGPMFWNLVAQTMPEYKKYYIALRKKGLELS